MGPKNVCNLVKVMFLWLFLLCVAVVVVVVVVDVVDVVVDVVLDSVGQGEHMLAQGQQAACSNILTKNILFHFYKALFSVEKKGGGRG